MDSHFMQVAKEVSIVFHLLSRKTPYLHKKPIQTE
jgi:hypothetical protein